MMNKTWMIVLLALPGCIRDAGECWVRDEEGGVGGGVIVGSGAGGFGDVPPEPQNQPASADPCVQTVECEVAWKSDAGGCQSAAPGPGATCKTYYRGQHRSLQEAKTECERTVGAGANSNVRACEPCYWLERTGGDPVEQCKKLCDKMNEECIAKCPKGDKSCMHKCNVKNGECLKECEK